MKPAPYNLCIVRGVTFGPLRLRCKDSGGDAVNLTGYTPYAQARQNVHGAVMVELAPEITDAAAGEITLGLSDVETLALPEGSFLWDLVLEKDGARRGPFIAGRLAVKAINTQPD